METENELSKIVIEHALDVHNGLGPGLFESAYENCLFHSLSKSGLIISQNHPIPIVYNSKILESSYTADLMIENKLIVEIIAVDSINEFHKAELLTYLRMKNLKLGLLINFNVVDLNDGIMRITNDRLFIT